MSETTIYRKPIKSPFDILNSQVEKEESSEVEFKIPIKKVFDKIPKPTELPPLVMPGRENREEVKDVDNVIFFKTPRSALNYIDQLIVDTRRPLKVLRFDLEEASTKEEAVKFIDDSKILSTEEKKKVISLLNEKNNISNEIKINIPEKEEINTEQLDDLINSSRNSYVDSLVPYLIKKDKDKKSYEKIMSDLGASRPMPKRDEPKNLIFSRQEYFDIKNKKKETLGEDALAFEVFEVENLRMSVYKIYKPKSVHFLEKSEKIWKKSENNQNSSAKSFLLEDAEIFTSKIVLGEEKFDGLRARPAPEPELVPVEIDTLQKMRITAESLNSNEERFPSEFEGHNVLVIRGEGQNPNIIKVIFDDKEIAKGEITEKGPNIKIKSEFKAGWIFKKTLEHRAFDEKILPFLKTFKIQK